MQDHLRIQPSVSVRSVGKSFIMHLQGGKTLPVVHGASFEAYAGECIALDGPSGSGKSSLLKMIFGNYRISEGCILVRHDEMVTDVATAGPRVILDLRRKTLGYVSQFLRAIPRVSCFDLIAARARDGGASAEEARRRAESLLTRLNLPVRLWSLAPATFSGGEQQRVNIACGFAAGHAIMLLDEPTASLDSANAQVVADIINECKANGTAIIGIFHDPVMRKRVADRIVDVRTFTPEHV